MGARKRPIKAGRVRISEMRSKSNDAYLQYMLNSLKDVPKKISTEGQCPSTQAIINRPIELDAMHALRVTPTDGQTTLADRALTPNELREKINQRDVTVDEVNIIYGMRQNSKNTLGQSTLSGPSLDRKESARQTFQFSQPAELNSLEVDKLIEMNKITEFKGPYETKSKKSLFERFTSLFHRKGEPDGMGWREFVEGEKHDK